jgi:iron complex outermembrane receptor protein
MQGGNRTIAEKNEMYQGVSKLNGKLYQQNWEISTSYAINNNNSQYRNYFLHEPLLQAIQNGVIDPTVMTNNQAIVNGLKITPSELSRTSLWFANGQLNGDLWRNDDFGLRYATGVQWRRETLENRPDDVFTTGQVASSTIKPYINAGRNTTSGFGELKLQYTDQVERV